MSPSTSKRKFVESDDDGTDRKILMAVDFGTTYSGLAWSQTRKVSTIYVLLTTKLMCLLSRKSRRLSYVGLMPRLEA